MRCVIWAAVSTQEQAQREDDNGAQEFKFAKASIPDQIANARELIERNDGWYEVHEPLIIPGHSRDYIFLAEAARDMPAYAELLELTRSGGIDLVICRGRDRLGRTDALIAQVEEYLASYNVQIHSMSMPTRVQDPEEFADRTDRASIWMRSVERARAQDEIAEMKIRHRMGMRRRVKEGYHPNRVPYGYRLGPEGYGIPHEQETEVVRLLFRWLLEGLSYKEMVERLPRYATTRHPTATRVIQHILENPYYKGIVSYHRRDRRTGAWRDPGEWLTAPGLHEAIIDDDTWQRAQKEIASRRAQGRQTAHAIRPLSGVILCGFCGAPMVIRGGNTASYRYYSCPRCTDESGIHRNTIRDDVAHERVIDWLMERATNPELLNQELDRARSEYARIDEEEMRSLADVLRTKRRALQRWTDDYEAGWLDRSEFYGHKDRLDEEITSLEAEYEKLERRREHFQPKRTAKLLGEIQDQGSDLREKWRDPEIARKLKALLRQLGIRVEYRRPGLSVRFSE